MTSVLTSLLFSVLLHVLLSQELFDDAPDHSKDLQIQNNYEDLVNSFGGITNFSTRLIRQKKKKNHSGERRNHSGEKQSSGEQHNHYSNDGGPPYSPCGKKFHYVTDGREWQGAIRLKNIDISGETLIEADFVLPRGLNERSYQGKINLVNQKSSERGLIIELEVLFSSQNPVPRLVSLYRNQREICNTQPTEPTHGLVSLRLKYVFRASSSGQVVPFQLPQPAGASGDHSFPTQQINQFQDDNSVCGVAVAGLTQSLVIGGQAASRGEWPWLVAFYRSNNGNLEFICGGSLISSSYTLTAAHCVQDKGRAQPIQTQDALLFIGKHNLIQWNEEGFEKKGVKSFKIHPDWNPNDVKYDADLALIEMKSLVIYSNFIRPVCLWNGPTEIAQVVGQNGIVAGWGKNDEGKLNIDFPKKVDIPIVSDGECLRTHEAFVHITSSRTFCAGGQRGEGPCQGDSGGGLVLKVGRKWSLRGIVSASLRDGTKCDLNNFVVFTDVAKFIPWIKSQM